VSPIACVALLLLLLFIPPCQADPWDKCATAFRAALQHDAKRNVSQYLYRKPLSWLRGNQTLPLVVSTEGCKVICGKGPQWSSWDTFTQSFTTWVLPLLGGLLLQLPFESSGAGAIVLQLARWLGNPCVMLRDSLNGLCKRGRACRLFDRLTSIDATLGCQYDGRHCDIRATLRRREGAGAATPHNVDSRASPSDRNRHYANLRDALFILGSLDEFEVRPGVYSGSEPPTSLHQRDMYSVIIYALLPSDTDIHVANTAAIPAPEGPHTISPDNGIPGLTSSNRRQHRAAIAHYLRATRKRSFVPVFLSVIWFIVGLFIFIGRYFLACDASTYDLSIGFILSWLPGHVMCAVVNGNPTSSDLARRALQQFLDAAAASATAMVAAAPLHTTVSSSAAVSDPATSNGTSSGQQHASAIADSAAEAVTSTDANNSTNPHQPSIELSTIPAPTSRHSANTTPIAAQQHSILPQPQIVAQAPVSTADETAAVARQTSAPQQPPSLPAPQVLTFLGQHSHADGVADTIFRHLDALLKTHEAESSRLVYRDSSALDSFTLLLMCLPGIFASISELWTYNCVGVCYFAFLAMSSLISVAAGFDGPTVHAPRAHQPPDNDNSAAIIDNMENGAARRTTGAVRQPHHLRAIITALELANFILLLFILLGQPIGLLTSCSCASIYPSYRGLVVLSVGHRICPLYRKRRAAADMKVVVFACVPLLIVLYAVYAWRTQSFLASYDYDKGMRGLQRFRKWRYVSRGKWLAAVIRAARRCCQRAARAVGDRLAQAIESRSIP
jgi:hypothetical protein